MLAVSTGNHGQSVAYAARLFGVKATIVVPVQANPGKVAAMRGMGADVILHGERFDNSRAHCEQIAATQGGRYIHSGDEPLLIAGVATRDAGDARRPARSRHADRAHRGRQRRGRSLRGDASALALGSRRRRPGGALRGGAQVLASEAHRLPARRIVCRRPCRPGHASSFPQAMLQAMLTESLLRGVRDWPGDLLDDRTRAHPSRSRRRRRARRRLPPPPRTGRPEGRHRLLRRQPRHRPPPRRPQSLIAAPLSTSSRPARQAPRVLDKLQQPRGGLAGTARPLFHSAQSCSIPAAILQILVDSV